MLISCFLLISFIAGAGRGGGGLLLEILGGGVPHSSPHRDLILDQNISFFTSIFTPDV